MCRLYAKVATHVSSAADDLIHARNSLLCQSECDSLNRKHGDGWGVASYRNGKVSLVRKVDSAFKDDSYKEVIEKIHSKCIVGHVRLASKGKVSVENCHPFVYGQWTFAHNGTLTALDKLRDSLLDEIPKKLQKQIQGETDSELIFYWLIGRLIKGDAIEGDRCKSLKRMQRILGESIAILNHRNSEAVRGTEKAKAAKLTVLLTNGRVLVGAALGNPLHWILLKEKSKSKSVRQSLALASEPIGGLDWNEVPDGSSLSVSTSSKIVVSPLPSALSRLKITVGGSGSC
jgi:glutamine amidotransferase